MITSDVKLYHYIIKAHKNNDLSSSDNYVLDKYRFGSSPCGETISHFLYLKFNKLRKTKNPVPPMCRHRNDLF